MDEPTAGMSHDEAPVILNLIRALKKDKTKTILLVEHKMDVVRELADRIIVLHNGQLVADGSVELGFQQLSEMMNLPGIDGIETLRRIDEMLSTAPPVLLLTSRSIEAAISSGLRLCSRARATMPCLTSAA